MKVNLIFSSVFEEQIYIFNRVSSSLTLIPLDPVVEKFFLLFFFKFLLPSINNFRCFVFEGGGGNFLPTGNFFVVIPELFVSTENYLYLENYNVA